MKKEHLKKLGKISSIPNGWEVTTVGQACKIRNDLRKPISVDERSGMQGKHPYYGPTGILDFIDHYRVDVKYALIGEDGYHYLKPLEKPQTILAEGIIERRNQFTMESFAESVNKFLEFNEYQILENHGSITRQQAEAKAHQEYEKFNKNQKIASDFDKQMKALEKQHQQKVGKNTECTNE